jgi:hypothetical protein
MVCKTNKFSLKCNLNCCLVNVLYYSRRIKHDYLNLDKCLVHSASLQVEPMHSHLENGALLCQFSGESGITSCSSLCYGSNPRDFSSLRMILCTANTRRERDYFVLFALLRVEPARLLIPQNDLLHCQYAERAGFEPAVQLPVRQFSKLVVSATHPSLQCSKN